MGPENSHARLPNETYPAGKTPKAPDLKVIRTETREPSEVTGQPQKETVLSRINARLEEAKKQVAKNPKSKNAQQLVANTQSELNIEVANLIKSHQVAIQSALKNNELDTISRSNYEEAMEEAKKNSTKKKPSKEMIDSVQASKKSQASLENLEKSAQRLQDELDSIGLNIEDAELIAKRVENGRAEPTEPTLEDIVMPPIPPTDVTEYAQMEKTPPPIPVSTRERGNETQTSTGMLEKTLRQAEKPNFASSTGALQDLLDNPPDDSPEDYQSDTNLNTPPATNTEVQNFIIPTEKPKTQKKSLFGRIGKGLTALAIGMGAFFGTGKNRNVDVETSQPLRDNTESKTTRTVSIPEVTAGPQLHVADSAPASANVTRQEMTDSTSRQERRPLETTPVVAPQEKQASKRKTPVLRPDATEQAKNALHMFADYAASVTTDNPTVEKRIDNTFFDAEENTIAKQVTEQRLNAFADVAEKMTGQGMDIASAKEHISTTFGEKTPPSQKRISAFGQADNEALAANLVMGGDEKNENAITKAQAIFKKKQFTQLPKELQKSVLSELQKVSTSENKNDLKSIEKLLADALQKLLKGERSSPKEMTSLNTLLKEIRNL